MNRLVTRALSMMLAVTLFLSQGVISYATADEQPFAEPAVTDEQQLPDAPVIPDEQQLPDAPAEPDEELTDEELPSGEETDAEVTDGEESKSKESQSEEPKSEKPEDEEPEELEQPESEQPEAEVTEEETEATPEAAPEEGDETLTIGEGSQDLLTATGTGIIVSAVSDPAKGKFIVVNDKDSKLNGADVYHEYSDTLNLKIADLPHYFDTLYSSSSYCVLEPALGYYLEGIYTDAAMTKSFQQKAKLDKNNGVVTDRSGNRTLTLYPNWQKIPVITVIDKYGDKLGTVTIGGTYQLNAEDFEEPGYTITGFKNRYDQSIITPGKTVFKPAMKLRSDGISYECNYYSKSIGSGQFFTDVNPVYKANEYTVVYHLNASNSDVKVTRKHTFDDKKPITLAEDSSFTQEGIKGWKTKDGKKSFDCVKSTTEDVIEYAESIGTRTIDIYAVCDASNGYTVIFSSGLKGVTDTSTLVAAGETVKLTGKELSRKGYVITGWTYNDANGKEITLKANGSFKNLPAKDGKITLTAKWDLATYSLRFNTNPPTGRNSVTTKTVKYTTDKTQKLADLGVSFKNTGMEFTGWNTKKDGSGTAYDAKATAVSTVINDAEALTVDLYAQWKSVGYYIYLDPGVNSAANGSVTKTDNTAAIKNLKIDTSAITAEMAKRGSLQSVKYGEDFELSGDEFVRKGWTLTGWYNSKTRRVIKNSTLKNMTTTPEVIVLTAQWKEDVYKASYNLGGAKYTGETKLPATYRAADGKISLPDKKTLQKPGYEFKGWYDNKNFTGAEYTSIGDDILKNISLFAKWEKIHYKVVLDPNGAQIIDPDETKTYDPLQSASPIVYYDALDYDANGKLPTKAYYCYRYGYTFDSWNTVKNPTKENPGRRFGVGAGFKNLTAKNNETVVLYAQWKPVTYKIKYDLGGGKLPKGAPTTYTEKAGCVLPEQVERAGYNFNGWRIVSSTGIVVESGAYRAPGELVKQIEAGSGSFGDVTVEAIWHDNIYHLLVSSNSGKNSKSIIRPAEYTTTVPMTELAKRLGDAGCKDTDRIVAFTTKPDGSGSRYLISKAYSKLATEGDVELYAQWGTKDNYTITYEGISGATLANPVYSYDGSAVVTLPNPTKKNYVFTGWKVDRADLVTVSGTTTRIKKGAAGDITVTATFRPVNYKVVIDPNAPNAFYNGEKFSKTTYTGISFGSKDMVPRLERPGYRFSGYILTRSYKSGSTVYSNPSFGQFGGIADNGTLTLYAYWEPKSYNVVFADEGLRSYTSYSISPERAFAAPGHSKPGYVFKGWRYATATEYSAFNQNRATAERVYPSSAKGYIAVSEDKNRYVKSILKGNASDLLLIADEEMLQYNLKLSPNGGSRIDGNPKAAKSVLTLGSGIKYNDDVTDSIEFYRTRYRRSGYAFAGFALDAKGNNLIMDENGKLAPAYASGVSKLGTRNNSTVTVYAVWEKVIAEKPVITKAVSKGNNLTVNYSVSGTAARVSYEVQCSTNIVFVNADIKPLSGSVSAKNAQGSAYKYIRVRQIKTDSYGNKVYGAWSKRFAVTTNG